MVVVGWTVESDETSALSFSIRFEKEEGARVGVGVVDSGGLLGM